MNINIRSVVLIIVLSVSLIIGFRQYKDYCKKRAYQERLHMEQARAEMARIEEEREAERQRIKREDEARAEKRRREIEEEKARRMELQEKRKRELEEKKREAEKIVAATENYRRARKSFSGAETGYYHENKSDMSSWCAADTCWFVDEMFSQDGRIYEIRSNGEVYIIRPNKEEEQMPSDFSPFSLVARAGFLSDGGKVMICGCEKRSRRCPLPEYGSNLLPMYAELGGLLNIALELGMQMPKRRHRVTLVRRSGEKLVEVGIVEPGETLAWDKLVEAARLFLEKKVKRSRPANKLKPPVFKKNIRRTVVFYDGGISKKDIRGVVHIPRKFQYRYHGSVNYRERERAREEWKRFYDIALREEAEQQRINDENRLIQLEYERKLRSGNILDVSRDDVEQLLLNSELLVERARGKGDERNGVTKISERLERNKEEKHDGIRCYKCKGGGVIKNFVLEQCDACLGHGAITHEIELTNSRYVGDEYKTKKSKAGYDCPKCKRMGRIRVEKEVECPTCKGDGRL